MPPTQLPIGTWLFFIALGVIFVGILLIALGSLSTLNGVSGGAVIIIGPIPIVLGAGQYSFALAALAAILTVCALIFYLFLRKRT